MTGRLASPELDVGGPSGPRLLLHSRLPGILGLSIELAIVGVALAADVFVRWLTLDDVPVAVVHARDIFDLERSWGIDWEHAAQNGLDAAAWLGRPASWFYVWGYLPVIAAALVLLFALRPVEYARLRNALLAGGVAGLPFYVIYPLAPPRLSGLGFSDPIATSAVNGAARPQGIANEIAAMPSFHIGYLVIVAALVLPVTGSLVLKAWCLVHPALMAWVIVATGNHWVLDIPAGLAVAIVGLVVARRISGSGGTPDRPRRWPGRASGT